MLRNRALAVLQKTYDDSYLSCSTAIYYEGQGNEIEAMRHWRAALDQIYDYNANRAPPAYGPRTDTEKALQEALKQLELQCKERIDLLEALRISRQEEMTTPQPPPGKLTKRPSIPEGRGSLGQGTITAMQYSELSRPTLPHRPSQPRRTSSELAIVDGPSTHLDPNMAFPSLSRSASPGGPALPPRPNKTLRTPSPEKHTMRTTLRSGKLGEKSTKPRKPAKPLTEGSSKAATLAWSALGSRERFARGAQSESTPATASPSSRTSLDQIRRPVPTQWDSHSRRLVVPKDRDLDGEPSGNTRHSDEYCYARPSMLSVTAASSALNSSSYQDLPSSDAYTSRTDRLPNSRNGFASPSPRKVSRQERANDTETGDDSGEASERRSVSNNLPTRSPAARQPGRSLKPSRPHAESRDRSRRRERKVRQVSTSSASDDDTNGASSRPRRVKEKEAPIEAGSQEDDSDASESETLEKSPDDMSEWKNKKKQILKNLPAGVDTAAAKQILNDIVVQGDEVHWSDVAGLEIAKNALRETVVYPFLRPDLFMGLREPARGMLLFGPPGTGKTMLARAVATESKSTFFSISASSLTSKYLGESEKLVRALFGLARTLAPSIIFVDEIDSLLSQRSGSGEHEATMRIKTEFLIQWSDLQRAAAGREATEKDKERGDANRVLVLAATNLPWAIDEAARRRFVRRQYIPLPEPTTRETQIRTLLGQQKHDLSNDDILKLVELTDGFSGSDITALAKDAAMGPLRSLGEALLHMTMDEIRPIQLSDFEASLTTIRPSVSKAGLKEYEDWATEFGERGG
ncbi:adenosinetriphosphatase [Fusarium oxysporum NRRL 32931]|uniref:Adenosinetriphosphatase n=1 Tax=Fusarium oxysporum NRRL 32931 TaxID=660029 RepID=W9J7I7_FUSOX|nr:adenosinetriphosphatase [Fusarium oxysporum NRRL 32931]